MGIQAAIDIGSNSIKLLVLEIDASRSYRILHDSQQVTGLGSGLAPGRSLDPDAVSRSLDCIAGMLLNAKELGAEAVVLAGTAALRRAANAQEFIDLVESETGRVIRVLSGEEEARISRAAALRELPWPLETTLFFDVGGGSTELTVFEQGRVVSEVSLPLGARMLAEQAGAEQPPRPGQLEAMRVLISKTLEAGQLIPEAVRVAGLGGTATSLAWMIGGGLPDFSHHLYQIDKGSLDAALARLETLSLAQVKALPKMDGQRAPVFLPGVLIIAGILERYRASGFTLVDRGLRFGLLLEH